MLVKDQKESYKEVFKVTTLFGGVQVFSILISLIRSKIIAVLLGEAGMGIITMFQQPLGIVGLLSEMGLGTSSIRDITKAKTEGDKNKISKTIKTVKRWILVTGLCGALVFIVLSPLFSRFMGQGSNYTWAFAFLSIAILFSTLSSGQTAILRGLRRLKDTAKAGIMGSGFGLIISLPLYYFYGLKGIVPSLIITSVTTLLASWYFSRKVKLAPVAISYKESFFQGREMIKLGFIITTTSLISQFVTYIFTLYLNNQEGIEVVAWYNAGWAMTNQYIGLIFTAMTVDYFPRLVSLQSDHNKMSQAVNEQAEIAILIVAPLMLLFTSFLPVIIKIVYRESFLPIIVFAQWMILGMMLKTASWALSYIIVAKGDNRLFFFTEISASIVVLLLNIGAYTLFGLMGVGITFVILYSLYLSAMLIIAKKRYQVTYKSGFIKMFLFQFTLCLLCFLVVIFKGYPLTYIAGSILFIISAIYSLKELNNRMDIKAILTKRRIKK